MDTATMYNTCVDALKTYAEGTGFTDMVIGLSGGIDSSLVAAMSVDAFGAQHVHGVLLPGPYSSDHSLDDAKDLARNLGIESQVISICEPFEAFETVLAKPCGGQVTGVTAENTQARCRTVILMALSNRYNWMLVNTGNKSEAMMGYSTLYGDTAGAFAPLGGIYKTEVFALAHWRNSQAADAGEVEPIPAHVLVKPPSAELSPGQEDEKSLGIKYEQLDKLLKAHVEEGKDVDALAAAGFDRAEAQRIVNTVAHYAYKRAMEPPFPDAKFYDVQ